ncbi:MAG: NAD(P)/FAD-dependent oxidoreductase [Archaeoglobaceae archaeon]|nr:NAD(P)/FAD-dependent oxidoreductase [Archaeoglobaceae archaeon]
MILTVGAGPAGSLSSFLLAKKGYNVLIAEEHQLVGFPVQCAGLISKNCYESYSRYIKVSRCVEKKIKGAFFISPSGHRIEAKGDAFVIERKIFDRMLFEKTAEVAETIVKAKVRFKGKKAFINEKELKFIYLIGADGVHSTVARYFGFKRPEIYTALQVEVKYEPLDEEFVELYFGRNFSDFFAYTIPLDSTAKVGVICKKDPLARLENFLKHLKTKGSILELNTGAIPSDLVNFVKEKVVLLGDSAGMVKPYTGGGLYYLLVAAEKLAKNFPNLRAFKIDFLKEMFLDFKIGKIIRKLYSMPDDKLDELFILFKDYNFSGINMDHPSSILKKIPLRLLKKPSLAFQVFKKIIS